MDGVRCPALMVSCVSQATGSGFISFIAAALFTSLQAKKQAASKIVPCVRAQIFDYVKILQQLHLCNIVAVLFVNKACSKMSSAASDMGPPAKMRRLSTECFEGKSEASCEKTSLRDWPGEVGDMQDALLAKHGISSNLGSLMRRKIWITSAYSGLGTFEHVFSRQC